MLNKIIEDKSRIHTRDIRLSTYPYSESRVIVHGILKDKRYMRIFDVTGAVLEPGVIHHIDVKMMIKANPLTIEDIQAIMHHVPLSQCHSTLDNIEKLKGLEIKSGFSLIVRRVIGGKTGCTHLCNLVIAMAQEIVHGWLTWKRKELSPVPKDIDSFAEKDFLIDSCRMWTKDGPKMKSLEHAINAESKSQHQS